MSVVLTPEEQAQLLEVAAQALGYQSWADYQLAEASWSDPGWDD